MAIVGAGLRWVVEQCRAGNDEPDIARLYCGAPVESSAFRRVVPRAVQEQLHHEELIEQRDHTIALNVSCTSYNGIVSILPTGQTIDADLVHLNIDSGWLLQLVWELVTPGGRAAELGTGNGLIAAYLIARFNQVVATDIHGPSLRIAQLTLDANRVRGRDSAIVCTDIAAALRPGSFDLVVANPPWSPAFPHDEQGRVMTFADGGPTGTELPSRFLHQAADLLAGGGTAITLALDPTYNDGRRPLQVTLEEIRRQGFDVEVLPSAVFPASDVLAGLSKRIDGLVAAEHVAIVIRNPRD